MLVTTLLLLSTAIPTVGPPIVFTPQTKDAWQFSFDANAPVRDTLYTPSISDASNAVFQGYVIESPSNPGWGHAPPYSPAVSSFEVFKTFVVSDIDQTVALSLQGDDGHSLYINGVSVGGGGYGSIIDYNLSLTAGVPVSIEMVGYNSIGGWSYALTFEDNGQLLPISELPNLRMDAEGVFVPEASSTVLLGVAGGAAVALACLRNRLRQRQA